jgi:trans-aconitate 2-methyltransferase
MDWSAKQYVLFAEERVRPARDLAAAIPMADARHVVDAGCGPATSTEVLAARFPGAILSGFDSSPDMIEKARAKMPGVAFDVEDVTAWAPAAPVDVIFANAVFQWLPDHRGLFTRLLSHVAPGGSLALQMPDNLDEPSHVAMREAAASVPFAAKLAGAEGARTEIASAGDYYRMLAPAAARVDVWRTVYHHPLKGFEGIVEWFKGSGLRPYLAKLSAEEQAAYLARYRELIAPRYPVDAAGNVLLAFPRLFVVATR